MKTRIPPALLALLILLSAAGNAAAANVRVVFTDAKNNAPLAGVMLRINNSSEAQISDEAGICRIELNSGTYIFEATHSDYLDYKRSVTLPGLNPADTTLELSLRRRAEFQTGAIVVFDEGARRNGSRGGRSIEETIAAEPGVCLVRRAGFANEPIVNGIRSASQGLTIDGMQIQGACVDHMDPAAAYVEPQNLQKAEINTEAPDLEHSSVIGGGINLKMRRAELARPWGGKLGLAYNSNGSGRQLFGSIAGGDSSKAILLSVTQRASEDYTAGQNVAIAGSEFDKWNAHLAATLRLGRNQTLRASLLYDATRDVGYPAMIMDARSADAWIGALTHEIHIPGSALFKLESRVYANQIKHWMDDYDRSEDEIRTRVAMPGMNMPMYGVSQTMGLSLRAHLQSGSALLPRLKFNLFRRNFDADMRMINLDDPQDQAFVKTIGDYYSDNLAVSGTLPWALDPNWLLQVSARLELGVNNLGDQAGRRALEASTGMRADQRSIFSGGITGALAWQVDQNTALDFSVAFVRRAPTPIELYGNLLFEVSDGHFYLGNPDIDPEQALQFNLRAEHSSSSWSFSSNIFLYLIDDIVGGEDFGTELRQFENLGRATRLGTDLQAAWTFLPEWTLASQFRLYYGQNHTLDDPLGFIPQPELQLTLGTQQQDWYAQIMLRTLFASERVAQFTADTPPSSSAAIVTLNSGWQVLPKLRLNFTAHNLFDELYTDRLSVGALAHQGRGFRLGFEYTLN